MKNAVELRQERAKLITDARALLELAEEAKRGLTSEEEESYERMLADAEKLERDAKRIERQEELERGLSVYEPIRQDPQAASGDSGARGAQKPVSKRATPEYREAFLAAMRSKFSGAEARDLFEADDTAGGYLVPEALELQILKDVDDETVMRGLVDVRSSSTLVKIPVRTSKPTAAWIAEKGSYGKSDMEYGMKELDAHKCGVIIPISDELLADSAFDLEAEIRADASIAIAELLEEAYISGSGVGQPLGFLESATLGVTAASATTPTADELYDLKYSVKSRYRKSASARWLMKDATLLKILKLKDGQGNYLWQPSFIADQPDRVLNTPVVTSEWMPAATTGLKAIAYGDFKRYRAHDRLGISVLPLVELYAEDGEVGFRFTMRTDGRLLTAEAIAYMQMK